MDAATADASDIGRICTRHVSKSDTKENVKCHEDHHTKSTCRAESSSSAEVTPNFSGSARPNWYQPGAEARAIAKEAYIYGFPVVDNYRVEHAYFVDRQSPEFKAPWNQITNIPRVFTPADTAVQTPNSDTPYSWLGLDLRAEPIVLTLPPIEKERYFSVQLTDAYTFNFDYLGTRTTGNQGGSYAIAGPNWKGETPKGIKKVLRSETELIIVVYRTQLFNPGDIENVKKIQAGYKVEPLSAFLGTAAPKAAPAIDFIKPLTPETQKTSLEFFNILNFVLQFCPTDPSETELMARFAMIGVGAGKTFDPGKLSPEMKAAIEQGRDDAWVAFAEGVKQLDDGTLTSGRSLWQLPPSDEKQLSQSLARDDRDLWQLERGGVVSDLPRIRTPRGQKLGWCQPDTPYALRRASCRRSMPFGAADDV